MHAQLPTEATLVVSGEGISKEEAINQALRSAIEQAFGVFVSANTEILNDDIVKDEIATITSGNIKSYKELAYFESTDGNKNITVEATVVLGKLIEYSKSHGSKAEFAGATFGANLKLFQLNKRNGAMTYNNLLRQLECIKNQFYDYSLIVSEPKVTGDVSFTINVTANHHTSSTSEMIYNTLLAISLDQTEAAPILETGVELYKYNIVFCPPSTVEWYNGKANVANLNPEIRYFYNELDEKINEYICPISALEVRDNTGVSYTIINRLAGTTSWVVYSAGPAERSNPENIIGVEQGAFNLARYHIQTSWPKGVIRKFFLTTKNAAYGETLFRIDNTINIPLSHLETISSFSIVESDENHEMLNSEKNLLTPKAH